jgi:hypothetical protein
VSVLPAVEASVARAIAAIRETPVRSYDVDAVTWRAHGRLTCAEAREASERGISEVVLSAMQTLRSRAMVPLAGARPQ